jgi:hypothetical protein
MIDRVAPGLSLAEGMRAGLDAFEAQRAAAAERV